MACKAKSSLSTKTSRCNTCLNSKQESRSPSPDLISKGSLEDQFQMESRKEVKEPTSIFDKAMFKKSRVFDRSMNNLGKSMVLESNLSPLMKGEKRVEKSLAKSFIIDSTTNLSSGDENLEKIVEAVISQPLDIRAGMESKFLKSNMEKRAFKKYLISEAWMDAYSRFLNKEVKEPPGSIDNRLLSKLVSSKLHKGSIFAVNERLWKFLMLIYGGGPEVPYFNEPTKAKSFHLKKLETVKEAEPYSADATQMKRSLFMFSPKITLADRNYCLLPAKMIYDKFSSCFAPCFQTLLGVIDLLKCFEQEKYIDILNFKSPKFWKLFQDIIDMNLRDCGPISINNLKKTTKSCFEEFDGNDANEFLEYFLSGLQKEASSEDGAFDRKSSDASQFTRSSSFHASGIHELFGGTIVDCSKCLCCKKKSLIQRNYQILTLPVVPNKTRTIDDCIAYIQKAEQMKDSMVCSYCKEESRHVKKSVLYKFPKHLFVHLDRFPKREEKTKISDFVDYIPEEWKIRGKGDPETSNYSLISVITHSGSINDGIYNCFTKRGEKWYLCDDGDVRKVIAKMNVQQDAYILLYQKKG